MTDPQEKLNEILRAFNGLANFSEQRASELRKQLVSAWSREVKRIDDLDVAKQRLEQGIAHFRQSTSVEELPSMLEVVKRGLTVAQSLEALKNSLASGSSDSDFDPDVKSILVNLVKDLEALQSPSSWQALRSFGHQKQDELRNFLIAYAAQEIKIARQSSKARDFDEALDRTNRLLQTLPDSDWLKLPTELDRGIKTYLDDLKVRADANRIIDDIIKQLTDQRLAYGTAASQLQGIQLSDDDDIPTTDLKRDVAQITLAAEMEQALQVQPDVTSYAMTLSSIRRLRRSEIEKGSLDEQLKRLQEKLDPKEKEISQELETKWGASGKELQDRPQDDTIEFVGLFRQMVWWAAFGGSETESSASEIGKITGQAAVHMQLLLKKAEAEFRVLQDPRQLAQVKQILDNLLLVVTETTKGPGQWVDPSSAWRVPDWPASIQYLPPRIASKIDAVGDWYNEVCWILGNDTPDANPENSSEPPDDQKTGNGAALPPNGAVDNWKKQLSLVATRANDVAEHLKRLKSVWTDLSLEPWQPEESPQLLLMEADLHSKITASLASAALIGDEGKAMAGLAAIAEEIDKQKRLDVLSSYRLWVLQRERTTLRVLVEELRKRLIGQLSVQIANILDAPASNAAERLDQEVLRIPRSAQVAQDAYKAILDAVNEKASKDIDDDRRDSARTLWGVVVQATSSWAAAEPDDKRWWKFWKKRKPPEPASKKRWQFWKKRTPKADSGSASEQSTETIVSTEPRIPKPPKRERPDTTVSEQIGQDDST